MPFEWKYTNGRIGGGIGDVLIAVLRTGVGRHVYISKKK